MFLFYQTNIVLDTGTKIKCKNKIEIKCIKIYIEFIFVQLTLQIG